jgi:hypothetical protein
MSRLALFALCLMSSATIAFGSLWESQDWALLGTLSGTVGYDSNLTLLHNGPSSYFISENPSLTFSRTNSDTDVEINGGVTEMEFFSRGQSAETDPYFNASLAYPNGDNIIPVYKLNASWQRTSQPNEFVGERVENNQINVSGQGYITLTGKLGIRGTAEIDSSKFDSIELNDILHGSAFIGLTYLRNPMSELSLNVGAGLGHSVPNDPANTGENVHSTEYDFTARITGQISDKISGTAYGGFGVVDYAGGYTNRNYIPVAGADLTWGLDPRQTIVLAAYSGAANSPDGTAVDTSHAFLSYTDVVISGWQYTIRVGSTYSEFSRQTVERRDNSFDYGVEIAYIPSKRFRLALDLNYSRRSSDIPVFQFDHDVISLTVSYSF